MQARKRAKEEQTKQKGHEAWHHAHSSAEAVAQQHLIEKAQEGVADAKASREHEKGHEAWHHLHSITELKAKFKERKGSKWKHSGAGLS